MGAAHLQKWYLLFYSSIQRWPAGSEDLQSYSAQLFLSVDLKEDQEVLQKSSGSLQDPDQLGCGLRGSQWFLKSLLVWR